MITKVITLRDKIENNIDYLLMEYSTVDNILTDLNKIINLGLSYSNIFQWWCENEDKIDTINEILERQNSK